MLKFLAITSLLVLTGCNVFNPVASGPKFAVGDCMILESDFNEKPPEPEPLESWEEPKPYKKTHIVSRVEEIGKLKYRIKAFDQDGVFLFNASTKIDYDSIYVKIECPKRPK